MSGTTAQVDSTSAAYDAMAPAWSIIDDLCGGTTTMRARGRTYLPQYPKEENDSYASRLNRGFLFNGVRDAIEKVVAGPFEKPVTLNGDLPSGIAGIEADADRAGRSLTDFCRDWFFDAVSHGMSHVLVEYPPITGTPDRRTERLGLGVRPYLVDIKAPQLISAKKRRASNGQFVLSQVRYKETIAEDDGDYGECDANYIRVINAAPEGTESGTVELHRETDPGSGNYVMDGEPQEYRYPGIPLVTLYTRRTGFMTARPPFEDLAWLNIEHWQKKTAHSHALEAVGFAVLAFFGVDLEDLPETLCFGPHSILGIPGEGVDAKFLEHSGAGIGALEAYTDKLVEKMVALGLRPHVEQAPSRTATGESITAAREHSVAQSWAMNLAESIVKVYEHAATWTKETLPEDFSANVHDDFGPGLAAGEEIADLISMRQMDPPAITHEQFLREAVRLGRVSKTLDPEDHVEAVHKELADRDARETELMRRRDEEFAVAT